MKPLSDKKLRESEQADTGLNVNKIKTMRLEDPDHTVQAIAYDLEPEERIMPDGSVRRFQQRRLAVYVNGEQHWTHVLDASSEVISPGEGPKVLSLGDDGQGGSA